MGVIFADIGKKKQNDIKNNAFSNFMSNFVHHENKSKRQN